MKLAEALQERADINRRIEQLRMRLNNNVLVQEGEEPAEDPAELLKELNACTERLQELMIRINLTNAFTVKDGKTLTEWIACRDMLNLKVTMYRDLVNHAGRSADRARGSEIRIRPVISVSKLQKETDDLAKQLRLTDNLLQETNWQTELKEI